MNVSDKVIQDCVHVVDCKRLSYIPWETCIAGSLEISRHKARRDLGAMQERADTNSDLLLDFALKRMGLAIDLESDLML